MSDFMGFIVSFQHSDNYAMFYKEDCTGYTRKCATPCWQKLTKEEQEWLENNPNRQAYYSFDNCEDFAEEQSDVAED